MKYFNWIYHVLLRLKYPITLPEEIAVDLGVNISNFLSFQDFICHLTSASNRPKHLKRFMPRVKAEAAFQRAQRKEKFARTSLYSYYFLEGWLEFNLFFDEKSRLRRIYVQHRSVDDHQGIEISLHQEPLPFNP